MPSRVTITVSGAREIEAAMKELGVQAANRIARSARFLRRCGFACPIRAFQTG
jgi:hypothetical protein